MQTTDTENRKKTLVTQSSMPPYEEFAEMIRPLWESHWLTNMGQYHRQLENELREYLDVEQLSLTVNGHMALELTIQAMDFPQGSEVITTPFTFVSTTHAIVRNGLQPVFCDIKPTDYTIDESRIESLITERTVAIVPVHVYGNICNTEAIAQIARRHGLKVIYDAAHTFGETYRGSGIGSYGDASVFSFHATKVYNTIEGGAAAFSDRGLYERIYDLKNFGIHGETQIAQVGANAKMNEFAAIMGLCNLKYVDQNIRLRRQKAERYHQNLQNAAHVTLPAFNDPDVRYNYAYYPILLEDGSQRNEVYDHLKEHDIYARKYFYPLTCDAECFGGRYADCDLRVARDICGRVLVLPLYPELEDAVVDRISQIVAG